MAERALLIEPDAGITQMLTVLLRRTFGFDVVQTRTIPEGMAAMREGSFKGLVVDISQSSEGLRELTMETRRQKCGVIVLTTGRVDREALELFVHDDVYAVFPKPFDIDDIVRAFRDAIEFAQTGSKMAALLHGFLSF